MKLKDIEKWRKHCPLERNAALLEKACTADLAAHMNGWLSSPELKSPE
jgi:hypothetical protein